MQQPPPAHPGVGARIIFNNLSRRTKRVGDARWGERADSHISEEFIPIMPSECAKCSLGRNRCGRVFASQYTKQKGIIFGLATHCAPPLWFCSFCSSCPAPNPRYPWQFCRPAALSSEFSSSWRADSGTKPARKQGKSSFQLLTRQSISSYQKCQYSNLISQLLTCTILTLRPVSLPRVSRTFLQGFGLSSKEALNARRCWVVSIVLGRLGPRRPSWGRVEVAIRSSHGNSPVSEVLDCDLGLCKMFDNW